MALPAAVRRLGVVSLLTDASSEMILPLLPAFVTGTLRAGPAFLGLVEGAAEATASLLKIVSGRLSDRARRRKPLMVAGYGLASLARPLMALATAPVHVLVVRVADRFGKGLRGAPRDALIAEVTPPEERGRAFGFHRAMDHAGATVGPLLAAAVLWWHQDLRLVFVLAAVPAALCMVVLVFGVHEPPAGAEPAPAKAPTPESGSGRRGLVPYLVVVGVFTLGNSSEAFLLLRAQETGVALAALPLLWAWHHLVKAAASTHGGQLSDRWGRKPAILAGWIVYATAYAGLALADRVWQVWALFALYGLFHALTEGPERALIADLVEPGQRGRAFGIYHAVTGGLLLPASLLAGTLWERFGAGAALFTGAALSAAAGIGLLLWVRPPATAATLTSKTG